MRERLSSKRAFVPDERHAPVDGQRSLARKRRARRPIRSYFAGRFVDWRVRQSATRREEFSTRRRTLCGSEFSNEGENVSGVRSANDKRTSAYGLPSASSSGFSRGARWRENLFGLSRCVSAGFLRGGEL